MPPCFEEEKSLHDMNSDLSTSTDSDTTVVKMNDVKDHEVI